jgi:predicted transcriptional regulator
MDVDEMPAFFQCVHVLAKKARWAPYLTRTVIQRLVSCGVLKRNDVGRTNGRVANHVWV